jgi:hypothetical protein
VRQHWEAIRFEWIGNTQRICRVWLGNEGGFQGDPEYVWKQAAEFTRERLRQIAEIEEEIQLFAGLRIESGLYLRPTAERIAHRLICREQEALVALKKEMR